MDGGQRPVAEGRQIKWMTRENFSSRGRLPKPTEEDLQSGHRIVALD